MLASDERGRLIQWDVDPASWQERACHLVGRNLTWPEWLQYFPGQPYQHTCANHPVDATVVHELVNQASQSQNAALYTQAIQAAREINDAALNNFVCKFGSLSKFTESLSFCEEMVKADPGVDWLRGSRGLARALFGYYDATTLADLEAASQWYRQNEVTECVGVRLQILEQLKAGGNPFNTEMIEQLRNENC